MGSPSCSQIIVFPFEGNTFSDRPFFLQIAATRERLIAELSNSRPGQIFLGSMFVILAAAGISAIFTKRRTKSKGKGNRDSFDDANEGDFAGDSSSHDNEEEDNNHRNHHLDDSGIGR